MFVSHLCVCLFHLTLHDFSLIRVELCWIKSATLYHITLNKIYQSQCFKCSELSFLCFDHLFFLDYYDYYGSDDASCDANPAYIQNHSNSSEVFWKEFFSRTRMDWNMAIGKFVRYIDLWNQTSLSWNSVHYYLNGYDDTLRNISTLFRYNYILTT